MKEEVTTKRAETHLFIVICTLLFPILSIIIVGGYGFSIWLMQIIFGPPSI